MLETTTYYIDKPSFNRHDCWKDVEFKEPKINWFRVLLYILILCISFVSGCFLPLIF